MAEFFHSKIFQAFLLLGFGVLVFYMQVVDQHRRRMRDRTKIEYHKAGWARKIWMLIQADNKINSAALFVLIAVLMIVVFNQ